MGSLAEELHSLSLASDLLARLQRLDIGENAGLALQGAVGPMQDLQALLLSLGRLELLAMDHCGTSWQPAPSIRSSTACLWQFTEALCIAGFSDADVTEICSFAIEEARSQLSILRCLQLGPPRAAGAGAACFTLGTWWALSRMLEACTQLEVAHLWGATDEQAGSWAADLGGVRSGRGPRAASLSCTRMAAPPMGLHVRLSRLPGCVRHATSPLSVSSASAECPSVTACSTASC